MKFAISAGAFIVGMGAMWGLQNTILTPQVPSGYYDLSSLPDDFEVRFENERTLEIIHLAYETYMRQADEAMHSERNSRALKPLPASVPEFPNGKFLYEVIDGMTWPQLEDPEVQAVLDDAKGEWLVLNYWASWCGPCLKELPDMNAAVAPLEERGVRLIAINTDIFKKDTPDSVDQLLQKMEIDQLTSLFVDGEDMERALLAGGMPYDGNREFPINIIFTPEGEPYAFFRGIPIGEFSGKPFWASDEMLDFFEALVESEAA